MKIPLYILGFLKRMGSMHGYLIKKTIGEQVSDFARIKLPAIYYHLDRLEKAGWIASTLEREGSRPERRVFSVTEEGEKNLLRLLTGLLSRKYRPEFEIDAALYFLDSFPGVDEILASLEVRESDMNRQLQKLQAHREEIMSDTDGIGKKVAWVLFDHHESHYRSELDWIRRAVEKIKEIKNEIDSKCNGDDLEGNGGDSKGENGSIHDSGSD